MPKSRVGIVLVAALALAGCAGRSDRPDVQASQVEGQTRTLVVALSDEPTTYSPIFGDLYGSIYGDHWPAFNGVLGYDRNLELVPELAAALPEVSPDGRTVTVRLREGVTFHDGKPLTAADVAFTYQAILDPAVATALRDELLDSLERAEAVDERTVRFTLSRRDPAFGHKLTLGIVPEHVLKGKDLNTDPFNKAPVGSGPYVFEELRAGERIVFTRNEHYWGGRAGIDRLVYTFVPDENARATQLANGSVDVDAVGLSPRVAQRFDGGGHRLIQIPGESLYLLLNNRDPVLGDVRVRQALAMAVDRKAIAEGVFAGTATPTIGVAAAGHWAALPDTVPAADPAGAKALLAAAGWSDHDGNGILDKDGRPLAFPLVHGTYAATISDTTLAIRAALKEVGADARLEGVSFEQEGERRAQGASALGSVGNVLDPDLDWYGRYQSAGADDDDPWSNSAGVKLPAVDAALERARATAEAAPRREAYVELQRALLDDASYVPLVQIRNQLVVSDRISGVAPQPREGHLHGWSRGLLWNLREWSLRSG